MKKIKTTNDAIFEYNVETGLVVGYGLKVKISAN